MGTRPARAWRTRWTALAPAPPIPRSDPSLTHTRSFLKRESPLRPARRCGHVSLLFQTTRTTRCNTAPHDRTLRGAADSPRLSQTVPRAAGNPDGHNAHVGVQISVSRNGMILAYKPAPVQVRARPVPALSAPSLAL
jgi:hypothetical protein